MLSEKREMIDDIDKKIVALLEKRYECVSDIKKIKQAEGISILDCQREDEVLEKVRQEVGMKEYEQAIVETFQAMMMISKSYQRANK